MQNTKKCDDDVRDGIAFPTPRFTLPPPRARAHSKIVFRFLPLFFKPVSVFVGNGNGSGSGGGGDCYDECLAWIYFMTLHTL